MSVCLSVSVRSLTRKLRGRTSPIFLCMFPVAVANWSFSDVAICYVLPVLSVTSCFRMNGPMARYVYS